MRLVSLLASFGLIFASSAGQAKENPPIPLARNGTWELNYDDNACHLLGRFGSGPQQVDLRITKTAPGDNFDLTLAGQVMRSYGHRGALSISFPPANPVPSRKDALLGTIGETKIPMAHLVGTRFDGLVFKAETPMPSVPAALEQEVRSIVFTFSRRTHELKTGSMAKPMAMMRDCLTDLVRHWGYDPEVQAKLQTPPTPISNPANWLNTNDYPKDALNQSGLVRFRLDVSEAGDITGCVILQTTRPDRFADLTCALITKRGKFAPALDFEGKPTRAYFVSGASWRPATY